MKNYWLEKIRQKEVAERWTPPTYEDEDFPCWIPLRPPGGHSVPLNCCANLDGLPPQEPLFVTTPPGQPDAFFTKMTELIEEKCNQKWKRMEIMSNSPDMIFKGDKCCGDWNVEIKNTTVDENLTANLENLKLQVMAQNPCIMGVSIDDPIVIPDHIVLDTTNIPNEITVTCNPPCEGICDHPIPSTLTLTIGQPEPLDILPQTLTLTVPEEERYGPDERHWYLDL